MTASPRARDLDIPFEGDPGRHNGITDVPGVEVGYETVIEGDDVRTGVTAVLPLGRDGVGRSCPAGWFSLNGNGEMTGTAWVEESGSLSLPIGITNTHAVGLVHRGVIEWATQVAPDLRGRWLLPVVAETWDGYLNDPNAARLTTASAGRALDAAAGGPLAEGSVGGGAGMNLYGFKGGTGTASRTVVVGGRSYTVGVIMQANFGARRELLIAGRPVGRMLADEEPMDAAAPPGAGSCIAVVATDAPLLPGQCRALARRVPLGLARTGTSGSHFSGDLFLAFSTANVGALDSWLHAPVPARLPVLEFLPWGAVDPFYEAVVQAVEEAVLNVLVAGRDMIGRAGHRSPGFPIDQLPRLLA